MFVVLIPTRTSTTFTGFGEQPAGIELLSEGESARRVAQLASVEVAQFGQAYLDSRRVRRWPLGRVRLSATPNGSAPDHADVYLVTHLAGAALWEAWIPVGDQPLDATRDIARLLADTEGGPVAVLREHLAGIDRELSAVPGLEDAFPFTILRTAAADQAVDALASAHGADLVRLAYLDHSPFSFKPQVVQDELHRDFCLRDGGLQLLSQRGALDLRVDEEMPRTGDDTLVLAPRSSLPLLVTIELLLMERSVLRLFHERVTTAAPESVQHLLELKAEVLNGLEEYRGTVAASNRFSSEVTSYGKRVLGIDDLYDFLAERLDAITFEITTRYQQTTAILQFWLTVVFTALSASTLAATVALVSYGQQPIPVAAWAAGVGIVFASLIALLLRGRLR
jgi:hypothetical protein